MGHHISNGNGANGNGSRANGSNVTPTRSRTRSSGSPRSRRVTVIGGAGFVGSVLVPKLLEQGDEVTILDAFLYGTDSVIGHAAERKLQLVRGDLRSVESVVKACRDADAIVHLGGLVGDPSCAVDEDLTRQINLESTTMIGEVARGLGIERLVFASSCAVYGASDGLLDEEAPVAPVSVYAQTKASSEKLLLGMADEEFSPTVLRFGTFYGISPRPRFDLVVNLLVARAVREGTISIFGGNQWRPFVHVHDGAEAVIACLNGPREASAGEAFNVGGEAQNHTLREIATLIEQLVPQVEVKFEKSAAQEANYRVSFDKIRHHLGFVPRRSLVEGILEVKAAVESHVVADYRDARYDNHKTLAMAGTAGLLDRLAPAAAVQLA
jgi:nucleoside-diphosphate-sugar epimerase